MTPSMLRAVEDYKIHELAREMGTSWEAARAVYMRRKAAHLADDLLAGQPASQSDFTGRSTVKAHCPTCHCGETR